MSTVAAVALQLAAPVGELERNRERLATAVRGLDDPVELIVAPELAVTGYDLDWLAANGHGAAERLDGPTIELTRELAAERSATIVVGILERGDDARLYDTAVVVSPDGTPTAYRKSHLYPAELDHFDAGDELVTVPTPHGDLGVMICFEHAFPEVATTLALRGARIIVVPSAVPTGYEYVLQLRTRARAQDNQVFVVAANLTGGPFCGRSLIVDPRGEVLASAGTDEAVLRATLDLAEIERERAREPALGMRRTELYR